MKYILLNILFAIIGTGIAQAILRKMGKTHPITWTEAISRTAFSFVILCLIDLLRGKL